MPSPIFKISNLSENEKASSYKKQRTNGHYTDRLNRGSAKVAHELKSKGLVALILKNERLELHLEEPLSVYDFSRFDWTGKISFLRFHDFIISSSEKTRDQDDKIHGRGFVNEFGIDTALGFEEAEIGAYFHKIGVGALKKLDADYYMAKAYELRPAEFSLKQERNCIKVNCVSESIKDYAYRLQKEIELLKDGFEIRYCLENRGSQIIQTDEYNHNFLRLGQTPLGPKYQLSFNFPLDLSKCLEVENPQQAILEQGNALIFRDTPPGTYFFSFLNAGQKVPAYWSLVNHQLGIGISEEGDFNASKVNVWGTRDVISPELFVPIEIAAGESQSWRRRYRIFHL